MGKVGIELVVHFEGFYSKPYRCPAGKLTVGFGHVIQPGESFINGISLPEAYRILTQDLKAAEKAVSDLVKTKLTQEQFDALVDFVFNLGVGAFANSTLLKLLNKSDYVGAAGQFQRWSYVGKKKLPGLETRRRFEEILFRSGIAKEPELST